MHSQRERLEAFCSAQEDWKIVGHHEDRATGTSLDRPGLQAALDLARSGRADVLLVCRVDRLSRKVRQIAEELDKLGVVLKSATEPFDTGQSAGRMTLQMLAVFAEFERATIIDRITAGIERRAKQGHWHGRVPFGYRRDHRQAARSDERTTPILRRIFQLYTGSRLGAAAIARRFAAEESTLTATRVATKHGAADPPQRRLHRPHPAATAPAPDEPGEQELARGRAASCPRSRFPPRI